MAKPLNYQTLGNFCGNLFDGVKIYPVKGFDPTEGPISLRAYWERYAKEHESMPVCVSTSGTMLHVYDASNAKGTADTLHLFTMSLRTTTEDPS